jgi:hypothetical protein
MERVKEIQKITFHITIDDFDLTILKLGYFQRIIYN